MKHPHGLLFAVVVVGMVGSTPPLWAEEPQSTVAETKQAVKDGVHAVGEATRETTTAIGHGARDAAKAVGRETRSITQQIGDAVKNAWNDLTGPSKEK
jgi:hypothetical protein